MSDSLVSTLGPQTPYVEEMKRVNLRREILLSMWSDYRSCFKKLTVAATHTTSWKPRRPPTEYLVSPDASGAVCKRIPEGPFLPCHHFPTYDLGRNCILCFVVSSVFRRFEPRPLWAPVWHRQDGPVWEQHQTPEAPAVPDVQRPEAAQPQQQQPATHRNRSEIWI